jgi:hypothetical protein
MSEGKSFLSKVAEIFLEFPKAPESIEEATSSGNYSGLSNGSYRTPDFSVEPRLEQEADSFIFSQKVVSGERKGEVIEHNLPEILVNSKQLFTDNDLPDFASALPDTFTLPPESRAIIEKAMKGEYGKIVFDRAFIMPATDWQEPTKPDGKIDEQKRRQHLLDLKQKLVFDPNNLLPDDIDPYFNDETLKHPLSDDIKEKRKKPGKKIIAYIVLYSTDPIPCKGMTADQADKYFDSKKWDKLTLAEGLAIKANEQQKNQKHKFVAYDSDPKKSNWSWLLGTRVGSGGCAGVDWASGSLQFRVRWYVAGFGHPSLGARPAVVVPIYI